MPALPFLQLRLVSIRFTDRFITQISIGQVGVLGGWVSGVLNMTPFPPYVCQINMIQYSLNMIWSAAGVRALARGVRILGLCYSGFVV